jgi:hypothetical protein
MYARAVDNASARLRELRQDEWGNLGLAALVLGLAVAAIELRPELALPLFLGGLAAAARGVRALWRRWDLVEQLSGERDAYVITDIRAFALRETTTERRHTFAALIRNTLAHPGLAFEARIAGAADELAALAAELDDDELELDPAAAVACARLLSDVTGSPLLNPSLPQEDLRSRVRQIRSGFAARQIVALTE